MRKNGQDILLQIFVLDIKYLQRHTTSGIRDT